jgi:transcriptional regulator with XRE-family HTH domain
MNKNDMIVKIVKQWVTRCGSMREFAKITGISPATVSRIVAGEAHVTPETESKLYPFIVYEENRIAPNIGHRCFMVNCPAFIDSNCKLNGLLLAVLQELRDLRDDDVKLRKIFDFLKDLQKEGKNGKNK